MADPPRRDPASGQGAPSGPGGPVDPDALPGPELLPDAAATALHRARAAARARGARPGRPGSLPAPGRGGGGTGTGGPGAAGGAGGARRSGQDGGRSGARPDARDPQTVSASIGRLVNERGWRTPVAVGGVMGRWADVVGAEIAAHCQPETFSEGELVVRADSTAWATQVRLLTATVLRRLDEDLGEGVVTRLVVRGPAGPSWRAGSRSAGGRGPRDTYG